MSQAEWETTPWPEQRNIIENLYRDGKLKPENGGGPRGAEGVSLNEFARVGITTQDLSLPG